MNTTGTGTGPAGDDAVAIDLLTSLRQHSSDADLQFAEPPVRLTGGFETATYAFRLSTSGGALAGPLVLRLFSQSGASARLPLLRISRCGWSSNKNRGCES